jgi:hypothetical protein
MEVILVMLASRVLLWSFVCNLIDMWSHYGTYNLASILSCVLFLFCVSSLFTLCSKKVSAYPFKVDLVATLWYLFGVPTLVNFKKNSRLLHTVGELSSAHFVLRRACRLFFLLLLPHTNNLHSLPGTDDVSGDVMTASHYHTCCCQRSWSTCGIVVLFQPLLFFCVL